MKSLIFTGGHHNSSLEVAKYYANTGIKIIWFGHKYSIWGDPQPSAEFAEVTASGFKFIDLKAGKFYRTYDLRKLIRIPYGFLQSFIELLKIILSGDQIQGIVSFGGYLSVPVVIVGRFLGIPSITHEQTKSLGWANRAILPFVNKICLTWPVSSNSSNASKVVITGLPLRPQLIESPHISGSVSKSHHTLYITGGKQGSHYINQVVFEALPQLLKKYIIFHQVGLTKTHDDFEQAKGFQEKSTNYHPFTYDSQLGISSLLTSDVAVSRAGAHTTYELAVLNRKCVLIPLPNASGNEQLENAKILESVHQAIILDQQQLSPESLIDAIDRVLSLKSIPLDVPKDGLERIISVINKELLCTK